MFKNLKKGLGYSLDSTLSEVYRMTIVDFINSEYSGLNEVLQVVMNESDMLFIEVLKEDGYNEQELKNLHFLEDLILEGCISSGILTYGFETFDLRFIIY